WNLQLEVWFDGNSCWTEGYEFGLVSEISLLCYCFALVIHRVGEYLSLLIGDPRTQFLRCL
ncbi:hypothetical protein LINPERHAP1_LOCUS22320, partial [Linum perenne]